MDGQVLQRKNSYHSSKKFGSHFCNDRGLLLRMMGADVRIKSKTILSNLDFHLYQGEMVFVTGATGAGKTTLLNVIAKDYDNYEINGEINNSSSSEGRVFIGRIFQDLRVFKRKTVLDNLFFSFDEKIYLSRSNFESERDNYLKIFGIYDLRNNKLINTNGGVHQKVAIIRALLSRPSLIIADEPTSSLDKVSSLQVFEVLNHLNMTKNTTIVWATHNRELIKNFHGRVVHLEKGKILYTGKTCFI